MFQLDDRLKNDCALVGHLPLCRILLLKDANYPWVILVPQRSDVSEIYQLTPEDQQQLIRESSFVAQQMSERFKADKMNVAAIGNMVPQLHIHHVARCRSDAAWPAPVWGAVPATAYSDSALAARISLLQQVIEAWVD